jgi:hypothetical protein
VTRCECGAHAVVGAVKRDKVVAKSAARDRSVGVMVDDDDFTKEKSCEKWKKIFLEAM